MARNLNKNRILLSRLSALLSLLVILFTRPTFASGTPLHEILTVLGYFMVAAAAMGRLYASVFIGGFKNQRLIDYGPFSVVRNPLYTFSLIGVLGISLISANIIVIVYLAIFFPLTYHFLIKREESFLEQEFGDDYRNYLQRVPRLIPNFSLYAAPKEIEARPRVVTSALFDAVWWFAALPVIELVQYLQTAGILPAVRLF